MPRTARKPVSFPYVVMSRVPGSPDTVSSRHRTRNAADREALRRNDALRRVYADRLPGRRYIAVLAD
jgi:hypothetical protein